MRSVHHFCKPNARCQKFLPLFDCVFDTLQNDMCMIGHDVGCSTFANMKTVSAKQGDPVAAAADLFWSLIIRSCTGWR